MAQEFDFDIGSVVGPPGAAGNGIKSITLLSTSGLVKTYRITMTDDTTFDFNVSDGEDGNGISGASFDPQTNALTITFDDGTSFTTPSLKGSPGDPGDDGYSPAITIETITGGHRVTITDEAHPAGQSFDVMDGTNDAGSVSYDETATYQSGTVGYEVSELNRQLSDDEVNEMLMNSSIPGTTETVTFDTNNKPASVTHTASGVAVRTDVFTWGTNSVTEVRTLANGKHVTLVTNLTTLVTTISEIQEAS